MGLRRDQKGMWIKGFTKNIRVSTNVDAELWALRSWLTLCINLNLLAVEMESDAKVVFGWVAETNNIVIYIMLLLLWIARLSSEYESLLP